MCTENSAYIVAQILTLFYEEPAYPVDFRFFHAYAVVDAHGMGIHA